MKERMSDWLVFFSFSTKLIFFAYDVGTKIKFPKDEIKTEIKVEKWNVGEEIMKITINNDVENLSNLQRKGF